MPPKKRAAARSVATRGRRSARNRPVAESSIPDVYHEMLAEAEASGPPRASARPTKRRKLDEDPVNSTQLHVEPIEELAFALLPSEDEPAEPQHHQPVIYDEFEDSDDDIEFEDVELAVSEEDEKPEQKVFTVDVSAPVETPKRLPKRQIVSAAERRKRLEWHKAHLFLLLLSMWCRNRWCEDGDVQATLKSLVPRKVVKLLHEDESKSQLQRSHSFNKGIEEICLLWRTTWTTIGRGMRRATWRDDIQVEKESGLSEDLDFDDFRSAAQTQRGSRDLGAQMFCALLRSVAVETRLVCSLQALPFSAAAKGQTPEKAMPKYSFAPTQSFGTSTVSTSRKKQKDSAFPVYWVEVFSPAASMWIPLDPLVRNTINKPKTGFEPPASDPLNAMSYVVAIEDDGSARDVTRRYVQWFNAKTRKARVESTKDGEHWWHDTLAHFAKPFPESRDEIEDADLLRRSEAEGMPKNVQDFKGHPIYVLERHLRMNEVIHTKREVGKTAVGSGHNSQKLESVYRRSDVHTCRTSDAWYRRGRDVKQGEVPLKRVVRKIRRNIDADDDNPDAQDDAALYAEFQTEVYMPPPVVNGRIPRNAFGNIDVYVPAMIPAGAVHVQHQLAARAAKLMGVDYVEAVTGFEFKGRQGTAVLNGVVVSSEVRFGLVAVIVGLQTDARTEAQEKRSALLLALWKKWLTALRIRERIQREYGNSNDDEIHDDVSMYNGSDDEEGGGFVPEAGDAPAEDEQAQSSVVSDVTSKVLLTGLPSEPTYSEVVVTESPHQAPRLPEPSIAYPNQPESDTVSSHGQPGHGAGGFFAEDDELGGGFMPEESDPAVLEDSNIDAVVEQSDPGGGFLVDETSAVTSMAEPQQSFDKALADLKDPTISLQSPNPEGSLLYPSEAERRLNIAVSRTSPILPTLSDRNVNVLQSDYTQAPVPISSSTESPSTADRATAGRVAANGADELDSPTSRLSHDPDEDEMEPEWLLDSLGD
ncbi:uncharacterized protein HMPREF1541_05330 [Cyphellophora europaea CBS 101466]|uniref:Rad4 beta-hairpin domain-containing protein n=1 Tax=Cyphellophora europaea (strain CBS 101466) TaxID=1220924 RepID=W2RTN4_CYPE1|nr:uncharacterized protein HMPREF1541_05330 [Cyphellophora europaea CBS 101466]ETN39108.1 hypothetical protein HMPREF1541_05330 [Cyphellophora europaea CBS 101466]